MPKTVCVAVVVAGVELHVVLVRDGVQALR